MEMNPVGVVGPHTLTLLPTYQCTAECAYCCFQSSPRIKKRVPQERLLRYIDESAQFPAMALVVISGGEPFILGDDLVELIQRATDRGLLTRIVTNGYWGVTEKSAREKVRALVVAGLREASFSTGDDHIKFVPMDRLMTAIDACLHYGVSVSLMIEHQNGAVITKETVVTAAEHFPAVHKAIMGNSLALNESPWMKFGGGDSRPEWSKQWTASTETLAARQNCSSVLESIVVTPDEKLGMCCGLPRESIPDLNVGDLRTESMLSLYQRHVHDILKVWLSVEGPERILAWAASKDPSIKWEGKYAHMCDSCRAVYGDSRVMDVINKYGHEKFDEIMSVYAAHSLALLESPAPSSCAVSAPAPADSSVRPLKLFRNSADTDGVGLAQ